MRWIKFSEKIPQIIDIRTIARTVQGKYSISILHFRRDNDSFVNVDGAWALHELEWLDETDHSEQEDAFKAAREEKEKLSFMAGDMELKYKTFQDYLNSKNEDLSGK